MSARVDALTVFGFLRSHDWDGDALPGNAAVEAAFASFAKLIEADTEYDEALEALTNLNRRIAEHGWMDIEHDALRKAGERVVRAKDTRASALRSVQGLSV